MKNPQGNSTKEAWILCLILGVIMINFPFIHIFNNTNLTFGIPTLVLYFFFGWPASILVTWFFARMISQPAENSTKNPQEKKR